MNPAESNDEPPAGSDLDVHALFSPFKRVSPPFNFRERVTTAILSVLLLPIRVLYLFLSGGILWLSALIAMAGMRDKSFFLYKPLPRWRKAFLSTLTPIIRSILFVTFGVYRIRRKKADLVSNLRISGDAADRLREMNAPPSPESQDVDDEEMKEKRMAKAYVVVANHLGYIDILVLLAMHGGSFVAKGAIEKVPFVGTIAAALQCMFVREGGSLTSQLIDRVEKTYECHKRLEAPCPGCGSCMNKLIIFPEGTTCNGTAMVPFRTGVFNAGLPVKPVAIQFPGKHFNLSWESIRFREHIFRTMTQWSNPVDVTELPVYVPSKGEMGDARLYALNVQRQLSRVLEQPIEPLNRKHKFLYHSYLVGKVTDTQEIVSRAAELSAEDAQLQYFKTVDDGMESV